MIGVRGVAVLAAVAVGAWASAAEAATVRVINNEGTMNTLAYTAAPGEANNVTVLAADSRSVLLTDLGIHLLTPGGGCVGLGLLLAQCSLSPASVTVAVRTGDGSDGVDVSRVPHGGTYQLGPGNDRWVGGAGSADIVPGTGDDTVTGGTGRTWVHYGDTHAAGMVIDLAGTSGSGNERDVLRGVTGVTGTGADDRFTGAGAGEYFDSGGGTDIADGRGGDDRLWIWTGSASGGPGADELLARGAGAQLDGGDGDDALWLWGPGITANCGPGDDVVHLRGPMSNVPGPIAADCETVADERF